MKAQVSEVDELSQVLYDALVGGEKKVFDLRREGTLTLQVAMDIMSLWFDNHPRAHRMIWVRPIPVPYAPVYEPDAQDQVSQLKDARSVFLGNFKKKVLPQICPGVFEVLTHSEIEAYLEMTIDRKRLYSAVAVIDTRGVALAWGKVSDVEHTYLASDRARKVGLLGLSSSGNYMFDHSGNPVYQSPEFWDNAPGRIKREILGALSRALRDRIEKKGR